jgi:Transposase IS66 family
MRIPVCCNRRLVRRLSARLPVGRLQAYDRAVRRPVQPSAISNMPAAAEQIAATVRASAAVYNVIAPTRGKCVPTDLLAGVRPKVWLSDRLPAQCTHAEVHQFCLAHLIRDAQYAIDHGDTIFAPQFKAFLKDACAVGHRRPDLADSTIATHRRRLDRERDRLLDLKPTDVEGSHLRATIAATSRRPTTRASGRCGPR